MGLPSSPRVSVVIVNWNTRDDLARCLSALEASECADSTEVVVVDNASSDGSAAMVREQFPNCTLLASATNEGFARGNNRGLDAASGEYVMLLNPDATVARDTIARLVRFLEAHPRAGAVGPRLLNPDGTLQYSCRAFPTLGAGLFRQSPLGSLFPHNRFTRDYLLSDWDHAGPREVDWLSGACLLLRRDALASVGGHFDEQFYMYCEEVDLCYRLRQAGWDRYYEPRAVAVHAIGQSSNKAQARMILHRHRSMLRYFRKHHCQGGGTWLAPLVAVGIGIRCLGALMRLACNRLIDRLRRTNP